MSQEDATAQLTFEELSALNDRKLEIKKKHNEYIDQHPEIKSMLNDFMSEVLLEKPADIFVFAAEVSAATNIGITTTYGLPPA